MNYKYFMIKSLNDLLRSGERYRIMFYGTLVDEKKPRFGFFGITKKHFMVAIMDESQRKIETSERIPLDIRSSEIKKCLIPGQIIVTLEFEGGKSYKIRIAKKVPNIEGQEQNVADFLELLEKRRDELCAE